MRLLRNLTLLLLLLTLSCAADSSEQLLEIIEDYQNYEPYDRKEHPMGLFTEKRFSDEATFAQALLDKIQDVPYGDLSETDQISYTLLKFVLQDKVAFNAYERYLNPLLSDAGFHLSFPYIVRPIRSLVDAHNYLEKLRAMPEVVDQQILNIRKGLEKGVSQPRVIFNGYASSYNTHLTENVSENYFFSPFLDLPGSFTLTQMDSLSQEAQKAVNDYVIPSYEKVKQFFESEFLPNTRKTIGVSDTPEGKDYYQNRIDYYTTSTDFTAESIHQKGLEEVARIRAEMDKIIYGLGYEGTFSGFLDFLRTDPQFYVETGDELLMHARDIAKRSDEKLPSLFHTLPRKPYGVAPVPDAIAPKYTAGRYVGTSKDSQESGYYWVNTYNLPSRTLYTLPALTAHEAVPGHHLQGSLNNELPESIPSFRRNLYLSAYGEGWGLYSEFLGDEMGLYRTPYEKFGQLTYEMWRACRLVVDTGIHALGWSREQAFNYMKDNTALSIHEINTEVDRYISWPGQALSYKIGEIKIRELRKTCEDALRDKFDIRDFHEVILSEGTVTLSILENRIMNYIENKKSE